MRIATIEFVEKLTVFSSSLSLFIFFADANAVVDKSFADVGKFLIYAKKNRGSVTKIANRLGNPDPNESEWLILTPKDKMPQPDVVAYPKPPKAADGSLIYERIPSKCELEASKNLTTTPTATTGVGAGAVSPVSLKRRHPGDDLNGVIDNNSKFVIYIFHLNFSKKKTGRFSNVNSLLFSRCFKCNTASKTAKQRSNAIASANT